MEYLFSPFRIKTVKLANRIVMPPLASFLLSEEGDITNATIETSAPLAIEIPRMVSMERNFERATLAND